MSKSTTNGEESQNKGGRNPKYNAEFFTMPGYRSEELDMLKMKFGAEGVDFFVSVFEKLCVTDYFIFHFDNNNKLELLAKQKDINKELFLEILKYSVEEVGLFNKELYEKGYIFSEAFLKTFEGAGLFQKRSMKMTDVLLKVKEIIEGKQLSELNSMLKEANHPLAEVKSEPASVQVPKEKETIADNSEEREENKKEKQRISKAEIDSKETKESLKSQGGSTPNGLLLEDDGDLPF